MELHNLKPASGSTKTEKRLGRGQGSGTGGTSTRGHKGAKSRRGYSRKRGFEGGQMPLQRRVPKFGFTNNNRIVYKVINVEDLAALAQEAKLTQISPEILANVGLVSKNDKIKILGNGEITLSLQVKAHAFSKSAKDKIEANQGSVEIIS